MGIVPSQMLKGVLNLISGETTKIKRQKGIFKPNIKSLQNEYQDQVIKTQKFSVQNIIFQFHLFTAWVSLARIDIWVCRAYHSTCQLTAWVFVSGSTTFAIAHCPDLIFDHQQFFCINFLSQYSQKSLLLLIYQLKWLFDRFFEITGNKSNA